MTAQSSPVINNAHDPALRVAQQRMIDLMRSRGIGDESVLQAMAAVPRHLFMTVSVTKPEEAYADYPLSIGYGQTISQPYIVAYMTQLLRVRPGHRVLEIGSGCGYQAAILAQLGAFVTGVERLAPLLAHARDVLKRLGCKNIRLVHGDGYDGGPDPLPYDRILLACAPPEIPDVLTRQLAEGGRMVAPVGAAQQELVVIDKNGSAINLTRDLPVRFVPMVGSLSSKENEQ